VPELAVDPAALRQVARPLAAAADRLAALSAALPAAVGTLGPHDLVHALEDATHVWQPGLRALATAAGTASRQLVSAASTYETLEALLMPWSEP
jgi:uncharacterized protein YukE